MASESTTIMLQEELGAVRKQIRRVLTDYPNISRSMLGIHVRPTSGRIWSQVFDDMIREGEIIATERLSSDGRTPITSYTLAE